jgi:hypothetical protein
MPNEARLRCVNKCKKAICQQSGTRRIKTKQIYCRAGQGSALAFCDPSEVDFLSVIANGRDNFQRQG